MSEGCGLLWQSPDAGPEETSQVELHKECCCLVWELTDYSAPHGPLEVGLINFLQTQLGFLLYKTICLKMVRVHPHLVLLNAPLFIKCLEHVHILRTSQVQVNLLGADCENIVNIEGQHKVFHSRIKFFCHLSYGLQGPSHFAFFVPQLTSAYFNTVSAESELEASVAVS